MNPVRGRSERTVDFNANSVSRIPRWCRSKITDASLEHSSTCLMEPVTDASNGFEVVKRPSRIFSKKELIAICEPPPLQKETLQAVLKAKQDRQRVNDNLKDAVAHADFLKEELKNVKIKIERISRELESPLMDEFLEFAGESEVGNPELFLAKHNHHLRQELLKALDKEDHVTQELDKAHRRLWEARLADNSLSLEVENELNPVIEAYDIREEFMMQKRAFREKSIKQNARSRRTKALKIAKQALRQSNEAQSKRKNQATTKILGAKDARRRIEHHLKKSMQIRKEHKLLQMSDERLKQDKQHKSLSKLKTEINEQREALKAQNERRMKRLERMEEEKERIRQDLVQNGQNPYFVEHLLAIEERRAQVHRKILQKEMETLVQLQKDYENAEREKFRKEFNRQKWDRFWALKFAEKKRERTEKEAQFFIQDEFNLMNAKNRKEALNVSEVQPTVDAATSCVQQDINAKQKSKSKKSIKKTKSGDAPSLVVLEDSNVIDFSTSVGGQSYAQIRLQNVSAIEVMPKVGLLNPSGPFLLCNAVRNIPPDEIFTLKFRFKPEQAQSVSETIEVKGNGSSSIILTLNGSCTTSE